MLEAGDVDLVFLDVAMPGLNGLEIAKVLARFKHPPRIVFVTAHDAHAVDAFELNAVDYLLKPIREERLRESVRRASRRRRTEPGRTRRHDRGRARRRHPVRRRAASVTYAEAQGDYVRLHTSTAPSHLIRTPLGALADGLGRGRLRTHPPQHRHQPRARARGADGVRVAAASSSRTAPSSSSCRSPDATCGPCASASRSAHSEHRTTASTPGGCRVTNPLTSAPAHVRRSVQQEIDESTGVGEVYMRSLIRSQLMAALTVTTTLILSIGALPIVFLTFDSVTEYRIAGVPLPWIVLGVVVYPALFLPRLALPAPGRARRAGLHRAGRASRPGRPP